jgi:AraC-like DNA-binding protein/mannose-6-phosphate isomerase-like protein (cupin superfamily)
MLFHALKRLRFEPFIIDHLVDKQGRFEYPMSHDFPFLIKLFSFAPVSQTLRLNWHDRLELFVPVEGEGQFRMGEQLVDFSPGDIIVVDNLKLHGLSEFRGGRRHALVVTFLPNLIHNLGSPLCDFVLISPFYCQREAFRPILRSTDRLAAPAHSALVELVNCYFHSSDNAEFQGGCKAYLLEVLYHLTRHFRLTEMARSEYIVQQQRARRLAKLFDYLQDEYAEKLSVASAAAVVAMSESQFMKFFKRATGMTFVAYLTHVRLNRAYRLLTETGASIAEVATSVGFSDQSYFDKRFKEAFHQTPREIRSGLGENPKPSNRQDSPN